MSQGLAWEGRSKDMVSGEGAGVLGPEDLG